MSIALDTIENIKRKALEMSAQTQPATQIATKLVASPPITTEQTNTFNVWSRLAELLSLDKGYVNRVCSYSPDWCTWLYNTIMGTPTQIPSSTPSTDILMLIEHAGRRGYKGVAQKIDVEELAKSVAEFVGRRVKEFGRPVAEARQRVEEALKVIKEIHGSKAQPVIEGEIYKRLRNMVEENTAKSVAQAVARASTELPPPQAVVKIEQIATAVGKAHAEAKEKPPTLRQAVQSPEQQQKPLRPSAEVKSI
jgi:hypothetical protein